MQRLMCMLTFLPGGVQPDPEALTNGAEWNNDGHGFAIVAGNRLIIRKSMDAEALIADFVRLRAKHPKGPALFHSRWGTGGRDGLYNCHPFRFGGDRRTVVAHNGILPAVVQPGKKEPRCDTRIAADTAIGKWFGHLSSGDNRESLARWIGPHNKLVILTVNPAYPENAYVINENLGVWDGGIWYSNHDYLPNPVSRHVVASDLWWDECLTCPEGGEIDPELGFCLRCETCVDCQGSAETCQCYLPGRDAESDESEYAAWWAQQRAEQDARSTADKQWWADQEEAFQKGA